MINKPSHILFWEKMLLVVVLCLMFTESKSQPTNIEHKNFASVSLTQLIYLDIRLAYERRINPSQGIRLAFSYKPAVTSFTDATIINLGLKATGWCYRYTDEWLYISLGYRYYFNKNKTIYTSPELFYKKMNADNIVFSYGGGGGSTILTNIYEARSMKGNIMGMNLLLGKKFRIKCSEGFHLGFDMFAGLSIRYKSLRTWTFGSVKTIHPHDSSPRPSVIPISQDPLISNESFWQISPQFGLLLYVSWK